MTSFSLPEVRAISIYRNDVVVERAPGQPIDQPEREKRGSIKEFSDSSRRRLAFAVSNTLIDFKTMITLTYPNEYTNNGREVKQHLRAFLQWMRRRGCKHYLWFIEFQERGAPHYHILTENTDLLKFKITLSARWYRIVASGDPKHLAAGTRTERIRKQDGARRYAVKYAAKMRQKTVPDEYTDVGRFWGMSKHVAPPVLYWTECDDLSIRAMLSDWRFPPSADRPVYRVLFGATNHIVNRLPDLDSPEE